MARILALINSYESNIKLGGLRPLSALFIALPLYLLFATLYGWASFPAAHEGWYWAQRYIILLLQPAYLITFFTPAFCLLPFASRLRSSLLVMFAFLLWAVFSLYLGAFAGAYLYGYPFKGWRAPLDSIMFWQNYGIATVCYGLSLSALKFRRSDDSPATDFEAFRPYVAFVAGALVLLAIGYGSRSAIFGIIRGGSAGTAIALLLGTVSGLFPIYAFVAGVAAVPFVSHLRSPYREVSYFALSAVFLYANWWYWVRKDGPYLLVAPAVGVLIYGIVFVSMSRWRSVRSPSPFPAA